ncbi:PilW family protein [Massilia sp. TSP1-1-2]|uniref:PilW family protein n=1 Tax=unclassified Massilia TaxID=2609279 RepID=UPI003CEBA929
MKRERGFTISELLVAVAVGAFVILIAAMTLVSASASYVAQTEAAMVDDAGRFALAAIERAARQAGFADLDRDDAAGEPDPAAPPFIMGLDAASLSSDSDALTNPRPAAINGSDVLALRFAGSGKAGGDGSALTCAGFTVGAGQEGWSIFYVGSSAKGEPELRCKYRGANNWSAEAVVGGVDSFQVLYGVDTDAVADGQANRFVSATDITAHDANLAPEADSMGTIVPDTWWKRVASIKVALVLHGARRSKGVGSAAVFDLFGAAYSAAAPGDLGVHVEKANMALPLRDRERRTFSSTIQLRNVAH